MYLVPKDPVIQTIIEWINSDELDLQPDFQRDEVWSIKKKQLLIDTVLREWQMPPVFVIVDRKTRKMEVLDGQQRLRSIHDFCTNKICIDGKLKPSNVEIQNLNGVFFDDLSLQIKRQFLNFPIRFFEIIDYEKEEPFELFYRLNQSVVLTSAERRNTFYGDVRNDIHRLVDLMEECRLNKETIGFTNFRLAYHDVIARFCYIIESGTLDKKITDAMLVERYRGGQFQGDTVEIARQAIAFFAEARDLSGIRLKLSKPTLLSWLLFINCICFSSNNNHVSDFIVYFESIKEKTIEYAQNLFSDHQENWKIPYLCDEFKYRSSTSVNDAKAVKIRHFVLCYLWRDRCGGILPPVIQDKVINIDINLTQKLISSDQFVNLLDACNWGKNAVR